MTETKGKERNYRVIFDPPDGHPKTFKDTRNDTNPETGEDVPVEIERPYLMDMTVRARSEQAAKLYAERHALNKAIQEAGSEDADEVLAKQWKVKSVKAED